MKIVKYVGRFSGAEAQGISFPKNVPVPVENNKLAEPLVAQPDFVLTDFAELEASGPKPEAEVGTKPAPAPAPKPAVAPASKE